MRLAETAAAALVAARREGHQARCPRSYFVRTRTVCERGPSLRETLSLAAIA